MIARCRHPLRMPVPRVASVAALAAGLLGCGQDVTFSDNLETDASWSLVSQDELHHPYVVGTPVVISTHTEDGDTSRWTVKSSDEDVLRIDRQRDGMAWCTAVAAGTAEIAVYADDDTERAMHRANIAVRVPTRIVLKAHGPLLVDEGDPSADEAEPRIVVGGDATFLVRYYDAETRLYGNRAVRVSSSPGLEAAPDATSIFESEDWIRLSPRVAGDHTLAVRVGGRALPAVRVVGVAVSDIRTVRLVGQDEDDAEQGQTLAVLARTYDASGRSVYGASVAWAFGGVDQTGFGDVFRYAYDEDAPVPLHASFGDVSSVTNVHASEGYVQSSSVRGCSMVPGGGAGSVPFLAAVLAAATWALRKREQR